MKIVFLFPVIAIAASLNAQDLSGTWEGTSPPGAEYIKLVIVKTGDHYSGYTYDKGMGYCKANFYGQFNSATKKFKGRGDGMIEKTFWHTQCVYNMNYSKEGNTH